MSSKVSIWNQTLKIDQAPNNGQLMIGNGVGFTVATINAGSNVTITNKSGSIEISSTNSGGTVTGVTAKTPLKSTGGTTPEISIDGAINVTNGGTGNSTLTLNNVLLGNGTSSVQFVAPGAANNLLTSDGTTWISSPSTQWNRVNKTVTQSITSSTTFTSDSELSFSVSANKTYAFRVIYTVSYGAGGYKMAVNGPSSPTRMRVATFSTPGNIAVSTYDNSIGGVNTGAGSPQLVTIAGVLTNGSNSGTLVMRIAQGSSDAAASNFEAGSFLEWVELF